MDFTTFLMYLGTCFGLSLLIGVERQYRKRTIGLRTTILVSIGAFLFVSYSFYVSKDDLTRVAAQIVSGIGFLGAGVILKDGIKIRGLTTAATLWCDAAIGVLCAAGALKEAIAGTLIILFANTVLRYVNRIINHRSEDRTTDLLYKLSLTCEKDEAIGVKERINDFIKYNSGSELKGISITKKDNYTIMSINLGMKKTDEKHYDRLVNDIYSHFKVKNIQSEKVCETKNDDIEDEL